MVRPTKGSVAATGRFQMRATPGFFAALDKLRGKLSRADLVRELVREEVRRRGET